MKPRTVCFCQPILSMISASVTPFLRWSVATTWAVLLPVRAPLGPRFARGHLLRAGGLGLRGSLLRRHVGRLCANRGYWVGGLGQVQGRARPPELQPALYPLGSCPLAAGTC